MLYPLQLSEMCLAKESTFGVMLAVEGYYARIAWSFC